MLNLYYRTLSARTRWSRTFGDEIRSRFRCRFGLVAGVAHLVADSDLCIVLAGDASQGREQLTNRHGGRGVW